MYILVSAVKMYDSSFLILGSEVETGFNIVDNSGVCLYAERWTWSACMWIICDVSLSLSLSLRPIERL